MMREVPLETLPNVNIRDLSHDKNLPIILSLFDVEPVLRPSVDERLIYTYRIKVMKVETTNLTSTWQWSGFEHGSLRCKSMNETFTLPIGTEHCQAEW